MSLVDFISWWKTANKSSGLPIFIFRSKVLKKLFFAEIHDLNKIVSQFLHLFYIRFSLFLFLFLLLFSTFRLGSNFDILLWWPLKKSWRTFLSKAIFMKKQPWALVFFRSNSNLPPDVKISLFSGKKFIVSWFKMSKRLIVGQL